MVDSWLARTRPDTMGKCDSPRRSVTRSAALAANWCSIAAANRTRSESRCSSPSVAAPDCRGRYSSMMIGISSPSLISSSLCHRRGTIFSSERWRLSRVETYALNGGAGEASGSCDSRVAVVWPLDDGTSRTQRTPTNGSHLFSMSDRWHIAWQRRMMFLQMRLGLPRWVSRRIAVRMRLAMVARQHSRSSGSRQTCTDECDRFSFCSGTVDVRRRTPTTAGYNREAPGRIRRGRRHR